MFRRFGPSLVAVVAATAFPTTAAATTTATTAAAATAAASEQPARSAPAQSAKATAVAHRGASAYAPENTIAAFRLARAQRADVFELDVQETKDHELVVVHDTDLARTTNAERVFPRRSPWKVSSFTLAQIRRLDAGSWFGARFKGEKVPTLRESLRAMRNGGIGVLVEVKSPARYPGIERRVAAELRRNPSWLRADPRGRRLAVQSFDWKSMRRFHALLPAVPIGLLGTPKAAELPGLARFADQINPPHTGLTASYVKRVHKLGMEVCTWTVNGPAGMRRALRLGVDGVATNKPDVLRKVLDASARRAAA